MSLAAGGSLGVAPVLGGPSASLVGVMGDMGGGSGVGERDERVLLPVFTVNAGISDVVDMNGILVGSRKSDGRFRNSSRLWKNRYVDGSDHRKRGEFVSGYLSLIRARQSTGDQGRSMGVLKVG